MDKRSIRDLIYFIFSVLLFWLYLPHILLYLLKKGKRGIIGADVNVLKSRIRIKLSTFWAFVFLIHNNRYYRSLFYYRIGPVADLLISWYRPGDKSFIIPKSTRLGQAVFFAHPYATVLNAESIGDSFSFRHLTTIGNKSDKGGGRPIIGNNVTLGANVTIIGNIKIGNNVIIGAGSVVVKSVPDNCIVAGNPAKIIKYLQ